MTLHCRVVSAAHPLHSRRQTGKRTLVPLVTKLPLGNATQEAPASHVSEQLEAFPQAGTKLQLRNSTLD